MKIERESVSALTAGGRHGDRLHELICLVFRDFVVACRSQYHVERECLAGYHMCNERPVGLVTFIEGRPGRAVAALCFCAAAIGLLMLLRSFRPGRLVNLIALLLLMVPPLLYGVSRH